ncbi:P-loop containing nucleoside triphosphate hydrolase protein [Boletus reticuloceps]|uniref:RNA helicase n=1 Tax=Boletus reticuloceps TaxID=495285 RepID=A0A8I3AA67_9AGAM|nr:P-loop containing nucleoside triphosphate hydrolase protein [Boletus reticuloceps]
MAPLKRKRSMENDPDDQDIDIASALTGTRPTHLPSDEDTGDEGLDEFIHDAIVKRDVKGGTHMLKKIQNKRSGKADVGGGSFQSMGLHPHLLRALTIQGYRTPTPIQRATIPSLLATPPRDLVGMARTGSGKTLAYMVPLVQRLNGRHVHAFGTRAIILVPARELALQVLRVGKSLARGWKSEGAPHAGDGHDLDDDNSKLGSGECLRWGLIVGGEGMDEQFEMISGNPDVIIATPGRLLHLIVEMSLSLTLVQYVVFDEADRLFELGFSTALSEILARLPSSRQTLLFSATLPKSLVEFAKAGLRDPKLVRLDAESKISTDLRMAFFSVKQSEKDACLLSLLRDVIKVPFASNERLEGDGLSKDSKGKGKAKVKYPTHTAPHQTLVFAATKHHVEYLSALLTAAGYAVSALYGSLVQSTRTFQMSQFLAGKTQILVVTDVAARGIDIPILEHVINYDFPVGARIFVHRVGRTARAGRKGWAWSFVTHSEAAYLCDLQLFLARPLLGVAAHPPSVRASEEPYTQSLILGPFPRDALDAEVEYIRTLYAAHHSLPSLRGVMDRGQSMYERSRGKASAASYKRAKEMAKSSDGWTGDNQGVHPVLSFIGMEDGEVITSFDEERERKDKRLAMVRAVSAFKPAETVFELGMRGKGGTANVALMKERRKALEIAVERTVAPVLSSGAAEAEDEDASPQDDVEVEMADEEDIVAVFGISNKKKGKDNYRDEEFYMSHYQKDAYTEKGYSLTDGASSFAAQAHRATFDIGGDVTLTDRQRHNKLTWDKKKKKFIKGDGSGADNIKLVRTENGTRLPASYRSGRFDEWKKKTKMTIPKIGEREGERPSSVRVGGGRRWKHNKVSEAKPLDKFSTDYERKMRQLRRKKAETTTHGESEGSLAQPVKTTGKSPKRKSGKRFGGKSLRRVKSEIKTVDQIHKTRKVAEKRRVKNARPSRKSSRS